MLQFYFVEDRQTDKWATQGLPWVTEEKDFERIPREPARYQSPSGPVAGLGYVIPFQQEAYPSHLSGGGTADLPAGFDPASAPDIFGNASFGEGVQWGSPWVIGTIAAFAGLLGIAIGRVSAR